MSNTFLTDSVIAMEAARALKNNCVAYQLVYHGYDQEFQKPRAKGASITIRTPAKNKAVDGPDITSYLNTLTEGTATLTVDQWKDTNFTVEPKDREMQISDFKQQLLDPAVIPLADAIDSYIFGTLGLQFSDIVGQPGITPASSSVLGKAAQRLDENGCPDSDRQLAVNPAARWRLADYLKSVSNPGMAEDMIRRGMIGRNADMAFFQSNNVARHTNGTFDGTPLIRGGSQTGATVEIDGFGGAVTGVFKKGDIITLPGCYAVKPVNGDTLPYLKQFVVTADTNSIATGTGQATVPIYPAIKTTNPGKTCSASPTNDEAPVLVGGASGAYTNNLSFHKNAIAMCMVPIKPLEGGSNSKTINVDGIAITLSAGDNILTFKTYWRLDILFGGLVINKEMGCRIAGE